MTKHFGCFFNHVVKLTCITLGREGVGHIAFHNHDDVTSTYVDDVANT